MFLLLFEKFLLASEIAVVGSTSVPDLSKDFRRFQFILGVLVRRAPGEFLAGVFGVFPPASVIGVPLRSGHAL